MGTESAEGNEVCSVTSESLPRAILVCRRETWPIRSLNYRAKERRKDKVNRVGHSGSRLSFSQYKQVSADSKPLTCCDQMGLPGLRFPVSERMEDTGWNWFLPFNSSTCGQRQADLIACFLLANCQDLGLLTRPSGVSAGCGVSGLPIPITQGTFRQEDLEFKVCLGSSETLELLKEVDEVPALGEDSTLAVRRERRGHRWGAPTAPAASQLSAPELTRLDTGLLSRRPA